MCRKTRRRRYLFLAPAAAQLKLSPFVQFQLHLHGHSGFLITCEVQLLHVHRNLLLFDSSRTFMASLCTVSREVARSSSRPLRTHACYRGLSWNFKAHWLHLVIMTPLLILLVGFRSCSRILAAQNFTMPAMSPTMTEGNIACWKVKEGKQSVVGH